MKITITLKGILNTLLFIAGICLNYLTIFNTCNNSECGILFILAIFAIIFNIMLVIIMFVFFTNIWNGTIKWEKSFTIPVISFSNKEAKLLKEYSKACKAGDTKLKEEIEIKLSKL